MNVNKCITKDVINDFFFNFLSGVCNFQKQCTDLAKTVNEMCPDAKVTCNKGRQGKHYEMLSFRVKYFCVKIRNVNHLLLLEILLRKVD